MARRQVRSPTGGAEVGAKPGTARGSAAVWNVRFLAVRRFLAGRLNVATGLRRQSAPASTADLAAKAQRLYGKPGDLARSEIPGELNCRCNGGDGKWLFDEAIKSVTREAAAEVPRHVSRHRENGTPDPERSERSGCLFAAESAHREIHQYQVELD
jgi:hypothetical protein